MTSISILAASGVQDVAFFFETRSKVILALVVSELLFERGILRKFLMMLLAAAGLLGCSVCSEARDAYVRLAAGGTFVVEGEHGLSLLAGGNQERELGRSATIALRGGKAVVGKHAFPLPVRIFSSGLLRFNRRSYRGDFLLTRNGLLNVLNLEDYLRGVLPAEVGAKWPQIGRAHV